MIMQAQVGVGISGLEGRQAVNASDFAIGQFRFLHRLLFIHGRWAYRRSSALILFSFYKNATLAYCLFFFSFNTGFSGTSMFHEHYTSMYNFYLATQIFWLACFDRDVDDRAAKGCEIPNFKGSYLGRFPLVLADFWTSDHLSERPRSMDVFPVTRARGTLTLKRR